MRKQVTLKDIAIRSNTSANTVSKALRNHPQVSSEKREEIIALAKQMGYVPNLAAQNLRQRRSNFIGLIVCDNTNPYFARSIRIFQSLLKEQGYYTLIFNNNEDVQDELAIITELCSLNVAGVLLTPALSNNQSVHLLAKYNIPYVLIHRFVYPDKDNYVVVDDEKAGYIATRHLLSRKPHPAVYLNYLEAVETSKARLAGYTRAMNEFGFKVKPEWVRSNCMDNMQAYDIMVRWIDTLYPPFSVLCYSDYIAQGVMSALNQRLIRIPEQVGVIGIDNTDVLSVGAYGLSTVNIPIQKIAEESVNLLMSLIKRGDFSGEQTRIMVEPGLVVRNTT